MAVSPSFVSVEGAGGRNGAARERGTMVLQFCAAPLPPLHTYTCHIGAGASNALTVTPGDAYVKAVETEYITGQRFDGRVLSPLEEGVNGGQSGGDSVARATDRTVRG